MLDLPRGGWSGAAAPMGRALAPPAVIAVVVTRDRAALLDACLAGLRGQEHAPDLILVVDNASGPETAAVIASHPGVRHVRLDANAGGAGGFRAGMTAALDAGASWLWLMDDDGRPATPGCLGALLASARAHAADMVGALVLDVDRPGRLAFPVRLGGRTRFLAEEVAAHGPVHGFAHLFNGVLLRADLLRGIGLPDPRFFIRGDEVEFLYRARAAGARIVLEPAAAFLHPGSLPEIFPILGGRFYAVLPDGEFKQFHQFRNRGWIFSRYGMWGFLVADVARYGLLYAGRRDARGFARWARATCVGVRGRFMRPPPDAAAHGDRERVGARAPRHDGVSCP